MRKYKIISLRTVKSYSQIEFTCLESMSFHFFSQVGSDHLHGECFMINIILFVLWCANLASLALEQEFIYNNNIVSCLNKSFLVLNLQIFFFDKLFVKKKKHLPLFSSMRDVIYVELIGDETDRFTNKISPSLWVHHYYFWQLYGYLFIMPQLFKGWIVLSTGYRKSWFIG